MPEQRPFAKTGLGIVLDPAADCVFGRNINIFRPAPGLNNADAGADLTVAVQNLSKNYSFMFFGNHRLAAMGNSTRISQNKQGASFLAFQFPVFNCFPADLWAKGGKQFGPCAVFVGKNEGVFLGHCRAMLALPFQIEDKQVILEHRFFAALVIKNGLPFIRRQNSQVCLGVQHFRQCGGLGGFFFNGLSLLRISNGILGSLGHGGNEPFIAATTPLARAGLP